MGGECGSPAEWPLGVTGETEGRPSELPETGDMAGAAGGVATGGGPTGSGGRGEPKLA